MDQLGHIRVKSDWNSDLIRPWNLAREIQESPFEIQPSTASQILYVKLDANIDDCDSSSNLSNYNTS